MSSTSSLTSRSNVGFQEVSQDFRKPRSNALSPRQQRAFLFLSLASPSPHAFGFSAAAPYVFFAVSFLPGGNTVRSHPACQPSPIRSIFQMGHVCPRRSKSAPPPVAQFSVGANSLGEIRHFTGVDSPYEAPVSPDLRLDTSVNDVQRCVAFLLDRIVSALPRCI